MNSPRASGQLSVEEIGQMLEPVELPPLCENPLVSILTANYNYARFIGEAIESAQKQTYKNWEMIICDDGSTDNSCEVIEGYRKRDPRIRLVRKQNGGQTSAANAAYRESKGQIVCFLDADDRFVVEKLERVLEAFRANPDSGFVGHRLFCFDASGRQYGTMPGITDPPSGWYGPAVVRHGPHLSGLAISSAQCLRREICDLIFPVSERFRHGPDGAMQALAPLMAPIVGIPTPLAEYRHHGNNSQGHIQIASRGKSSKSVEPTRQLQLLYRETAAAQWEAAQNYLKKVDPMLAQVYPTLDECHGTVADEYREARRHSWRGAFAPYRHILRGAGFQKLPRATRWFWRFSILLPGPVFRYAFGPSKPKMLLCKAFEVRRRYFSVRREAA